MVGSSKYAPLTNLPSQNLPPVTLPPHCVYKPSWQYPMQMQEKSNSSQSHSSSTPMPGGQSGPGSHRPPSRPVTGLSPISPAAAMAASASSMGHYGHPDMAMHHHRVGPPLPPPYELPSPASNASSYLNKNINSVEAGPISATVAAARAPEASSLVVNLLLADSSLHIFKDHNFDSCTMCVCNAAPKEVGNIRGADMYLPEAGGVFSTSPDDDPIRCTCGFSAIMNRRLSHRAGLFYEDEVEITGPAFIDDTVDRRKTSLLVVSASAGRKRCKELETADSASMKDPSGNPNSPLSSVDLLPQAVLELIREQCVFIRSSANALCKAASKTAPSSDNQKWTLNVLEFADGNEVASLALEQGRQAATQDGLPPCKMVGEDPRRSVGLHRWQFLRAGGPHCNQDIVRVMRHLQPLLQEAVQKKCTTRLWDAPYTVNGPLTWRQFHRLAGRGTEDRCEPQPVPSLVVGHDKDWLSLSPYALQNWEKLLLEPYSYTRDVAYIVVAPDNEYILSRTRSFFKELSATYEVCRLGRHCPITKVLRDGILRVGKTAAVKLAKEPVDEWFNLLTEGPTTNMLKLYAQVCRHHLAPHLTQIPMDKSLLDSSDASQSRGANMERPAPSPMPPPSTPDGNNSQSSISDRQPTTPKTDQHDGDGNHSRDPGICGMGGETMLDDEDQEPPAIVVYLVEPFSLGAEMTDVQRLACLGLLRCFTAMLATIPEHVRSNLNVQIVSLETILELSRTKDRERHNDIVRSQALSVFSQCRRLLSHSSNIKSLTGFGPAAMGDLFLKSKDEKNRAPYRLYIPPYILAPTRDRAESLSEGQQEHTSVLYCNYCLSEDQRFLLAACTDEHGEIFETVCISIEIPNRTRRKKASARRVGLQKLMDFILGVMSRSVQPWRLVVGRIGRIGHGELKGWSWLLSRKALLKASKHLKEICSQCSLLYPNDVPSILSACLVSLEPDSALRLMTDQFTPDERFSSTSIKCGLSTPQDVSCTHILVFPTSATSRSSQSAFQEHNSNGPELGDDDLLLGAFETCPNSLTIHRYVLEGYNALSWLALDSNSKDRLSCLPVHVQALMQLYHTFSALV
ncbi:hypothetical protein B566_EDAN010833 [Ephemera danica]|nr:hypothetical protein B566_EDAN010833 [Ephemera danica]